MQGKGEQEYQGDERADIGLLDQIKLLGSDISAWCVRALRAHSCSKLWALSKRITSSISASNEALFSLEPEV